MAPRAGFDVVGGAALRCRRRAAPLGPVQQQVIVLASHLPASFDPASGRVILDAAELRLRCPSVGEAESDEHLGAISDDLLLHSP